MGRGVLPTVRQPSCVRRRRGTVRSPATAPARRPRPLGPPLRWSGRGGFATLRRICGRRCAATPMRAEARGGTRAPGRPGPWRRSQGGLVDIIYLIGRKPRPRGAVWRGFCRSPGSPAPGPAASASKRSGGGVRGEAESARDATAPEYRRGRRWVRRPVSARAVCAMAQPRGAPSRRPTRPRPARQRSVRTWFRLAGVRLGGAEVRATATA